MTKNRLEAFSDGVIAIIITIMVLEMRVPHGEDLAALRPLIPVFVSYLLSFVFIGIYWNNHHHMLHATQHVNGATRRRSPASTGSCSSVLLRGCRRRRKGCGPPNHLGEAHGEDRPTHDTRHETGPADVAILGPRPRAPESECSLAVSLSRL